MYMYFIIQKLHTHTWSNPSLNDYKMELRYLKGSLMIILCLSGGLRSTRPASLGVRLTALENLLSTQVYLLRETIKVK